MPIALDVVKLGSTSAMTLSGDDDREVRGGALQVVALLVIAQPAYQKAQTDHAVEDDHQNREHRIAAQCRHVLVAQHHRPDQRHFDDDDREGERQRPERLAQPLRDFLRLVHHPERCPQDYAEQPGEQRNRDQGMHAD